MGCTDEPEVPIVHDEYRDGQGRLAQRRQLLDVHLKRTVTGYEQDLPSRIGKDVRSKCMFVLIWCVPWKGLPLLNDFYCLRKSSVKSAFR